MNNNLTNNETLTTTLASPTQIPHIINISTRVQEKITASGSLQIIGPFKHSTLATAITSKRCYVFHSSLSTELIGCVFATPISEAFNPLEEMSLEPYPRPWIYVHSFMLDPSVQGKGFGRGSLEGLLGCLGRLNGDGGGTAVLDTWAGNTKLREFYLRCGFGFVGVVRKVTAETGTFDVAVFVKELG